MNLRQARVAGLSAMLCLMAFCSAIQGQQVTRVAMFRGKGVGPSVKNVFQALEHDGEKFELRRITGDQIIAGELDEVDVLIHPGGSASGQAAALGKQGREAVKKYVKNGGGYLGICAGAYLATNDYSWSLNLIDAKVVDRRHWRRGTGTVRLRLSPAGAAFFGHIPDELDIYYGQGPLLGRWEWDNKKVPDYESLAIYETGIAKNGAPQGVMPGTSAIVRARYGQGRVFCFSPHPEKTDGRESMINAAVHWLAPARNEQAIELKEVTKVVRRSVPANSPGGLAVLVTRKGEVLHRKGYGLVKGRRMSPQTPLSLASITKQFAAMCAAILTEEGRLDLNQKVSHYLPDIALPVKGRDILVKDLVWHTSGLANFTAPKEKASIAGFKKQRGLDWLDNKTHAQWVTTMGLRRAPGEKFEYTNSGYVLLARIIETIAGEPFHAFQQRRIFDVLGMTTTSDSARFNGSGNMKTTLVDYTKWDRALWEQDSRLLSAAGYKMLFTQGEFDNGEPIGYGFGWRLRFNEDGVLLTAEHGGHGSAVKAAARNLIRRHVKDETTIAVFFQENPKVTRSDREALVSDIYASVAEKS